MKWSSIFKFKKIKTSKSSEDIRRNQVLLVVGVGLSLLVGIFALQIGFKKATAPKKSAEKPRKAVIGDFVDDRDVWASRIEAHMDQMTTVAKAIKEKNDLQDERLKSLEKALLASEQARLKAQTKLKETPVQPANKKAEVVKPDFSLSAPYKSQPSRLNASLGGSPIGPESHKSQVPVTKILHFSNATTQPFHSVNDYVVSGTHARALLTTGVVVSTAVQTQSNPQPIVLRLGDQGNLPRGFKSRLKDAVLIGSCYGDISSERAMCRIQSLSYVETSGAKSGQTVEKKVEGWVIGEDGAPGLRGRVVDKAGKVAREAMIAGMLSGLSSFFKNEARSSVFPASPFGQTNALNGTDAVKTGLGNGASNALEKLADFSIKRAEAMSPVLVVNPGRVVDVVFKSGFDLRPVRNKSLTRVTAKGAQ